MKKLLMVEASKPVMRWMISGWIGASALGALPVFGMAHAAEAEPQTETTEIIVTATRRAESTLEVPYNISAYGEGELERARITDTSKLTSLVSGLSDLGQGAVAFNGESQYSLRGLRANAAQNRVQPTLTVASVSTYFGDVPVFSPMSLYDIQRIEALRGPQGTLYGSGALGGTLRFIPNDPSPTAFEGELVGRLSATDHASDPSYGFKGFVNLPLSSSAALRLAGGYTRTAGFIDAKGLAAAECGAPDCDLLASGPLPRSGFVLRPRVKDVNGSRSYFARATLLIEPTPSWDIKLTLDREYARQSDIQASNAGWAGGAVDVSDTVIPGQRNTQGPPACPGGCFTPSQATLFPAVGPYEHTRLGLMPARNDINLGALEVSHDLGFAKVTSVSSIYRKTADSYYSEPQTRIPSQGGTSLAAYYLMYPRFLSQGWNYTRERAFTQEVRLVSDWDKPFDYVVGGYYQNLRNRTFFTQYVPGINDFSVAVRGFPYANPQLGDVWWTYDRKYKFKDAALFGELTWHLTDKLRATGGIRAFWQRFTIDSAQTLPLCGAFCSDDQVNGLGLSSSQSSVREHDVLTKFNISYDISDDTMIYALRSEGFRRGGPNAISLSGVWASLPEYATFKADTSTNYEIGIKGRLGGRATYSLAAFYIDWNNPQLDALTPSSFAYVVNGASAVSKGVEVEGTARLGPATISLAYTYTDAYLDKDFLLFDYPFGSFGALPPIPWTRGLKGTPLPATSKHVGRISASYPVNLAGGWQLSLDGDASYRSRFHNAISATYDYILPGFWTVNGAITLLPPDTNWQASLFVDNLTNTLGRTGGGSRISQGSQQEALFVATPRTVGINLTFRWKDR